MAGILVGISQTYIMLIMFLILMGLLGGGYHPASAPLISSSVEPEKRGRALGFHVVGGSASFFLTPIIAALIAGYWGWRGSYIGLAIPTAILGILFYIILGHGKADGHIQQINKGHPVGASNTTGSFRRLTAFLILTVLGGGAGYSIMGFIPLYIVDHFGASERMAASLLSVAWSAGLWASPLGGYLSDRFGRVRIILTSSIFSGVLIYLLNVVPFGWGLEGVFYINGLGIGTVLLFMGVSSFIRMPVSEAYIMSQAPVHRKSTIFGVYYFAMQQAGGVFAPIVGVMVDKYGFHSCFTIASIVVIGVTLLCSVFLLEGRKTPS
jgi:MFS family permease